MLDDRVTCNNGYWFSCMLVVVISTRMWIFCIWWRLGAPRASSVTPRVLLSWPTASGSAETGCDGRSFFLWAFISFVMIWRAVLKESLSSEIFLSMLFCSLSWSFNMQISFCRSWFFCCKVWISWLPFLSFSFYLSWWGSTSFLRMALISDQMFFISSVKTEKGTVSWGKRSVSGLSANVKLASCELALCWEGRRIAFSLLLSALCRGSLNRGSIVCPARSWHVRVQHIKNLNL